MKTKLHCLKISAHISSPIYLKSVEGSEPCQPISFQSSDLRDGSSLSG